MPQIPTATVLAPVSTTMAVQDDLATLFAKNLTLSQIQPPPPAPAPEDLSDNRIVYISQHYTHSAHIAPSQPIPEPVARPASEPDLADLEHVLRSHGVDTAALTLPQAELFRRADDAQKARLVQLWTICPPSLGGSNDVHSSLTWSATSLEQEEMLARRRWELAQGRHPPPATEVVMSLDGTEAAACGTDDSPVQSPDGRWAGPAAVPASSLPPVAHAYMEPYMQSGYEELARREYDASAARKAAALDPVYKSAGAILDWERQQWMENQYGNFVGGWRDDEDML